MESFKRQTHKVPASYSFAVTLETKTSVLATAPPELGGYARRTIKVRRLILSFNDRDGSQSAHPISQVEMFNLTGPRTESINTYK